MMFFHIKKIILKIQDKREKSFCAVLKYQNDTLELGFDTLEAFNYGFSISKVSIWHFGINFWHFGNQCPPFFEPLRSMRCSFFSIFYNVFSQLFIKFLYTFCVAKTLLFSSPTPKICINRDFDYPKICITVEGGRKNQSSYPFW